MVAKMSKTVEVTFEIDDDLYEQVKLFCEEHKITVEELIIKSIEFYVNPINRPIIERWVEEEKMVLNNDFK